MASPLYIKWNDSYEHGIPIIDEQHRGLVVLINTFHYILKQGLAPESARPLKAALDAYVTLHFQTEEQLMEKAKYPGLEEHIELHGQLRKNIEDTVSKVRKSGNPDEALNFLKDWWLGHINKADREASLHINMSEE